MEETGLHLPEDPISGMLDSDSPAMESNGDGFLPDIPVLGQGAEWSLDQVAPETLSSMVTEDSDASQDAQQQPDQQVNATVEKAVEQFQLASAQLFQEDQTTPLQESTGQTDQQSESVESPQQSQEMNLETEGTLKDGSQDGSEVAQVTEDGMELEEQSKETTEEPAAPAEPQVPSEFEKLFKGCEENPEDFNGWVYLLQYVEQENFLEAVRKAFDVFFLRYPYCYGYWKKYADIEKKHGNIQVAEEVYRRGLQVIPLSVDLWVHYMTFIKENSDPDDPETEGRIRAAYEHAVLAAGTDFRSDRLWESYVNWETEQQKLANVTAIYDRILGIPTQLYSQHFQRFKEHVQSNNPKHFLSEEEFVQLRLELSKSNLSAMVGEDGESSVAQEELPPGTEDLVDPAKRVTEIENMRHKVIEVRQEVFNHNEHEVSKRWAFEDGIKRPYFHVKALEKTQLNNWKEYLDFEIENGTPERVVVLFERCLIACALYEEFWTKVMCLLTSSLISAYSLHFPINDDNHNDTVNRPALSLRVTLICDCICCIRGWPACHTRFDCSICQLLRCIFFVSHYLTETYLIGSMKYAKYLEGYSTDGVRHVYKKACTIHLPKKPTIHLLWAAFEEQQGSVDEAREILKSLEAAVPGLAMVRLRRVSLERRHGNMEEAETLLREAIESAKNPPEASFYAVKLSRLFMKVQKSLIKARKVLLEAIEKDQTCPKLYLNLLELEYSGDVTQNEAEVLACFDRALKSPMPLESRLLFSQRKVEFLEDFGTDINVLVAAYEEHQKLQKESEPAKRKAENGYESSQEPDAKKQRVDDGSSAANAMTDMQANNSAYNYNWYQQYGGWGQNSWGQYNQYTQYNQYYPPPPT